MKKILITGANRGIGFEFVNQLLELGYYVIATCRNEEKSTILKSKFSKYNKQLEVISLDLSKNDEIKNFKNLLGDTPIDIFICNAGIYGPGFYKPEDARTKFGLKNLKEGLFDIDSWLEVFKVNLIAPLHITKAISENINNGNEKKLIYISSFMGSINDNVDGGHYIYRTSKSALNQLVKGLSIDLKSSGFTVVSLHPGWVKTDMGGKIADLETKTSVFALLKVIEKLKFEDTGKFFNYDGSKLNW